MTMTPPLSSGWRLISPDSPIEVLHLPHRTYAALLRAGIGTVRDLLVETKKSLGKLPGVGVVGVRWIDERMRERGFSLLSQPRPDFVVRQ